MKRLALFISGTGGNALNLVRACREDAALRDLPILVISAHRDDLSMQRIQQMGISGFLMKPVDASTLVAKVGEVLAG